MLLPPELRLVVYEHLLIADRTITINPHQCPLSRKKFRRTKKKSRYPRVAKKMKVHLDILLCNNIIQQEAAYVLYSRNTFEIWCPNDWGPGPFKRPCQGDRIWSHLAKWLEMIGPRNRCAITDLQIGQEEEYTDARASLPRRALKLLGNDGHQKRTLTVHTTDYIPGVQHYLGLNPAAVLSMAFPRMLERIRRDLAKSQPLEIFWRATLDRTGIRWDLESRIASQGWVIVDRENRDKLNIKDCILVYKLRV